MRIVQVGYAGLGFSILLPVSTLCSLSSRMEAYRPCLQISQPLGSFDTSMANQWQIPSDAEKRIRQRFPVCAYCGGKMEEYPNRKGCPPDKSTFEHLNRHGPFRWSEGLNETDVVMACGRCNSSRGKKLLSDWFQTDYCQSRGICEASVAAEVKQYLRLPVSEE